MNPEKIIEMFKGMGGGIIVLVAVVLLAVVFVGWTRIQKGRSSRSSKSVNPGGAPGQQQGGGGEGG